LTKIAPVGRSHGMGAQDVGVHDIGMHDMSVGSPGMHWVSAHGANVRSVDMLRAWHFFRGKIINI
jgi:hypothetical protein